MRCAPVAGPEAAGGGDFFLGGPLLALGGEHVWITFVSKCQHSFIGFD